MEIIKRSSIIATLVTACFGSSSIALAAPAAKKIHDDDVTGTSITLEHGWSATRDPVLLDTHGYAVYAETSVEGKKLSGHQRDAIARIAIAHKSKVHQLEELVAAKINEYKGLALKRTEIVVGGDRKAVALTGLPGTRPYSVVFTTHGNHVYEIGLWSDYAGIDARGKSVLDNIKFKSVVRSVASLQLEDAKVAAQRRPPRDQEIINSKAEAERAVHVQAARARGELGQTQADEPKVMAPGMNPLMTGSTAAVSPSSCGFTAPTSLYWQLQWDASNTFYSGTFYNLRTNPGWSAMSGNYGSWWGTNYHVGLCYTDRSNQYYANDWPGQRGANAYAAFSGYVEWAGWGTDGFYTLGNYVVVANGYYRNVTAHLNGIAGGVYKGAYIDGYNKVIGWVGSTGGNWDPHIHARVSWGESLSYNGQPYGGQSVMPSRLRCFSCNDQDFTSTGGAKSYTNYSHGKWMKY